MFFKWEYSVNPKIVQTVDRSFVAVVVVVVVVVVVFKRTNEQTNERTNGRTDGRRHCCGPRIGIAGGGRPSSTVDMCVGGCGCAVQTLGCLAVDFWC